MPARANRSTPRTRVSGCRRAKRGGGMSTRVVITGIGPVSNVGIGITDFRAALREGRDGISPITSFDTTGFERVEAGEVRDFHPSDILRRLSRTEWGRSSLFAAAAARLATQDAGLEPPERGTAVVI